MSQFANVPVVREREKAGLETDLVVLHAGALHGAEKKDAYIEMGVYHPEFKTPNKYLILHDSAPETLPNGTEAGMFRSLAGTGVHHWQPPDENAFWLVLWFIIGGMGLGAALIAGWQAQHKEAEKVEREREVKTNGLRRTTSTDRRRLR